MTEIRVLVLGLAIGAAAAALPLWLIRAPDAVEAAALRADSAPQEELAALRAEVARLRGQDEPAEAGRQAVVELSTEAAESAAAELEVAPEAVSPTAERLLAELDGDFVTALAARFRNDPAELYSFLLETWMSADQPERALDLFLRFETGPDAGDWAATLAKALRARGNEQGAVLACTAALRSGTLDGSAMRHLLELAPEQALELLQGGTFPFTNEGEQASFRGAALLCCGKTDEAWAVLDPQIASGGLDGSVWDTVIERAPEQAIERLRARIGGEGNNAKSYELLLAKALAGAGQRGEAVAAAEAVLLREPLDRNALRTLAAIEPPRVLSWLEGLTRTAPSDDAWGRYAEQLERAGRTQEAIGALTQAIELDASSSWTNRLLRLAPEIGAQRLTSIARGKRDDELLGDIADQLWRIGRKQQAQVLWREANALDPNDGEWTSNLRAIERGWDPLR